MLSAEKFDIVFDGKRIRGPEIKLAKGDLIELHGLSGAGCDALLLFLAGLLPHITRTAPAARGEILRKEVRLAKESLSKVIIDGIDLHNAPNELRARQVGLVFGEPELYILGETVWEEFKYGFAAVGYELPSVQALAPYGLYEKSNFRTETLSCGEQHRLNWASVLELRTPVILADLSAANLDRYFVEKLVTWLIDRSDGVVTIVYGLPPGSLGPKARQWSMSEGELRYSPPDPSLIPSARAAREALTLKFQNRNEGPTLLEVRRLCRDQVTVPVSFNIQEKEVLQIAGPNGSGKTTLGKLLTGQIRGASVGGSTRPLVNSLSIAMSFQYPGRSFLSGTVKSNLANLDMIECCEFTSDELGVEPQALSISRQKLLAIAVAMDAATDLVVLDEPTAGMDFRDKGLFVDLLNKSSRTACLIMSHDHEIGGIGRTLTWDEIRS